MGMGSFFKGFVKNLVGEIPIIGPAIKGGYEDYQAERSAEKQNEQNIALQRENNAFNAQQAEINRTFQAGQQEDSQQFNSAQAAESRTWQEQMSNTQYQRAIGDMQAAGINPMLAVSQGGAGTPSGATASSGMSSGSQASAGGLARVNNVYESVINTAKTAAEVRNTEKTGDLIEAQTRKTEQDTITGRYSAAEIERRTEKIGHEINQLQAQIRKLEEETKTEAQRRVLVIADQELRVVQTDLENKRISFVEAQTKYHQIQTRLMELSEPGAEALMKRDKTGYGQNVLPYLKSFGDIINSAGSLMRIGR